MNSFIKRTATGAVFAAVMLGGIYGGPYTFALLFLLAGTGCLLEFYKMNHSYLSGSMSIRRVQTVCGAAAGALLFIISFMIANNIVTLSALFLPLLLFSFFFIFEMYSRSESPVRNLGIYISGVVYISLPFSLLNFIAFEEGVYQYEIIVSLLLLIWANDTFAYITGISLGRKRLFERISPKKSWEGFFGGLLATILAAFLLSSIFEEFSAFNWVIIGIIVSVAGTLGDLVESMFKRSVSVKDSGTLLPGHGGMLDRFDGFMYSIPFVAAYISYIKNFL